jgi:hypothetical protein
MRQAPVWQNDASLWMASIERAPSGYAKGALARWLEDQDLEKDAAFWYREAVVQPPMPFEHSCFNLSRIHLKVGGPAAAIEAAQAGLVAGCERSAELMAPLALAYALTGRWEEALGTATDVGRDPTGKAVIAELSARSHAGDVQALRTALDAADDQSRSQLRAQVLKVLKEGGADVVAIEEALDETVPVSPEP